jgi:hypothetical protein
MKKKKASKSKAARGVRNLPAKTLTAKQARGVKGGHTVRKGEPVLLQFCATGTHMKEATITH